MTTINDYIHLYIGSDFIIKGETIKYKLVGVSQSEVIEDQNQLLAIGRGYEEDQHSFIESYVQETHLLLYPLSIMTDEDAISLCIMQFEIPPPKRNYECYLNSFRNKVVSWGDTHYEKWQAYNKMNMQHYNQNQTVYLLKRSYDIFNLIDKKLALDKSKIKL